MVYKHAFEQKALQEFIKAIKWYNARSSIAARNFVQEVDDSIQAICKQPDRFKPTYKHFRQTILKKYPFYIIYTFDEIKKLVLIFSIFHVKRNPLRKFSGK